MRQIGLMGGSFNPIHLAHVHLAREALSGGYVDEVIFLPTGNPPHNFVRRQRQMCIRDSPLYSVRRNLI